MERKSLVVAAALSLPLIGLGFVWADTHRKAQTGTDWDVPIRGYDPRDLLRGHYITYQYDWPRLSGNTLGYISELCIEGKAPAILRTTVAGAPIVQEPGMPPLQAKCAVIARAPYGGDDQGNGLGGGLYYVPQTMAAEYEKKLRDPKLQGIIRLRIRDDGIVRPIGLTFRVRPLPDVGQGEVSDPR